MSATLPPVPNVEAQAPPFTPMETTYTSNDRYLASWLLLQEGSEIQRVSGPPERREITIYNPDGLEGLVEDFYGGKEFRLSPRELFNRFKSICSVIRLKTDVK